MPFAIFVKMPSGESYDANEVRACTQWWVRLEATGRWWMVTEVYPNNPINERVRVAIAPYTGSIEDVVNDAHHVEAVFISHGSTEAEARILTMRRMQAVGKP